ncbi:hypothetical protein PIROE2DRAFT_41972, partial [Piromyces sp. E2]
MNEINRVNDNKSIESKKKNNNLIGIDINKKDKDGNTPLVIACKENNVELIKELVEAGANVNISDDNNSDTPLIIMCERENEQMVKYLIEHGAEVNKLNKYGYSALYISCIRENEALVKYLIEKGADLNIKNEFGKTPFIVA